MKLFSKFGKNTSSLNADSNKHGGKWIFRLLGCLLSAVALWLVVLYIENPETEEVYTVTSFQELNKGNYSVEYYVPIETEDGIVERYVSSEDLSVDVLFRGSWAAAALCDDEEIVASMDFFGLTETSTEVSVTFFGANGMTPVEELDSAKKVTLKVRLTKVSDN